VPRSASHHSKSAAAANNEALNKAPLAVLSELWRLWLIPKADSFWTFGKWRGSVRSRGARPPRVPSVAPRDRHGEVRVATCWFFQSPREGAWRCARGRARSPRRSRKDRYSTVHNLGAFGIIPKSNRYLTLPIGDLGRTSSRHENTSQTRK